MQPITAPLTPTSVYRYYDATGVLLYVGITSRATTRQREHNADKEWWPYVARQQVEHFPSRQAAHDHEKALIRKFHPPFNRQHNPDHEAIRTLYLASGLGGNRALRGGKRRPSLTSQTVRQLHGACKGRLELALAESDGPWVAYSTPPEYTQLITELVIPGPLLLLNPTKVAEFDHRDASDGAVRMVFKRTSSKPAPIKATLLIKARQPFSLFAHKVMGDN